MCNADGSDPLPSSGPVRDHARPQIELGDVVEQRAMTSPAGTSVERAGSRQEQYGEYGAVTGHRNGQRTSLTLSSNSAKLQHLNDAVKHGSSRLRGRVICLIL